MPNTKINEAFLETQEKIKLIFDFINHNFFADELPEVLLTIEPERNVK